MKIFIDFTTSKLRKKLLIYFFTNPENSLYLRELAIILNEDPSNLSKEMVRLTSEGLFIATERGNQKFFSLNKKYPLYKEIESIIFKTIGVEGALKKALKKIKGIKYAFIYGSFAENKQNISSDIDLTVVGEIVEEKLLLEINRLQKLLNREINYILFSEKEWKKLVKDPASFAANIANKPKIILLGEK